MNTRRKFFLNGSMAAVAILTIDPFKSIANSLGSLVDIHASNMNSVAMTHFGKVFQNGNSQVVKQFAKLKNKYSNLVLLQKGENTSDNQHDQFSFIDSLNSISTKDYDIIFRGKTKIGIITYGDGLDPIKNVNDIAIFLKEQKSCNLVVCLSSLGFKSENSFNDLSLAESSTHIDIIAGVHISNYCKQPYISRNKNKEEVIINYAGSDGLAFHTIEIGFDKSGSKNHAKFTKICKTTLA